jgi:hypothetical protein
MPKPVDALSFEKLVASKSKSSLQEVTNDCRPEAGEKSLSAFFNNDLSESTYQTTVISDRVKLDSGLDSIETSQVSKLGRKVQCVEETDTSTGVRIP